VKGAPRPDRDIEPASGQYREGTIRITIRNTSPNLARKVPVKHDLPSEIRANDVLDAGGLQVATDARRGVCYVFKEEVEIGPGESVTYNVKIRDRWNVNGPRIGSLKSAAKEILDSVVALAKFESVEQTLKEMLTEIEAVEKAPAPITLNDEYVAYFRQQTEHLDRIEENIYRVKVAMRPDVKAPKLGFALKAPSHRTTWLIIYIILGFLAVVSLLFFLRWYGRSKAEKIDTA
jgi:hypothetical protein